MILVLHQGAIGDFLLTLSVIQPLGSNGQSSAIEVIASTASARWAARGGAITAAHSPESMGMHTLFQNDGPLAEPLADRLSETRLVLSFLGDVESPVHARLQAQTSARVISVDPRPTTKTLRTRCHITDQWANDIRGQDLDIGRPTAPHIETSPASEPLSPTTGRPRIMIHPGSGGRRKCWPVEDFLFLADRLKEQRQADIAWMLGPAELELEPERFEPIRARVETDGEPLVMESLLEMAAQYMAGCDLYIGNDGGMTHVAAATGCTTVALFAATDPKLWRPLGNHVTVVATKTPDQPMAELDRTAVLQTVLAALP